MNKKVISIIADKDSISVLLNQKVVLNIKNNEKTINGDDIYKSLDYSYGDTYEISKFDVSEEFAGKNYNAAFELHNLYQDIVDGISKIDISTEIIKI